jgi:hypothetical protein
VLVQNAVEFDAMTMDFSLTGAQLRTRRPIKEKASVSIVLYEPHGDLEKYQGQESIKLSGRIVWQRPDGETFQCGVAYDPFTTSNACRCRSASNTSAKTPASDQANKLHWSPTDQAINQNRCCRALAGLLNLDHKTGEGFLAAHQHLVRNTGWNMGHIAGTQFLACSSFNGSAANFSCAEITLLKLEGQLTLFAQAGCGGTGGTGGDGGNGGEGGNGSQGCSALA